MKNNEEQSRSLFGISLSDRPKWQQFLICSSGFFFGYLVNGVCENWVFVQKPSFDLQSLFKNLVFFHKPMIDLMVFFFFFFFFFLQFGFFLEKLRYF
ncbi:hypothetical protein HanLR1_Chr04g0155651 [Helianthus annuus]|nr:hypothetical protein HanLR1_Chr04g0155651 [Helianthus annuus]